MNKWEDITSYRRNDTVRRPSTFKLKFSEVSIVVTYTHMDCPKEWVYRIQPFDSFVTELNLKEYEDMEEAKEKALNVLKEKISNILKEIDS